MNRALTYFVCASVLGVASVLSAQEEAANNEAKDSVTELDPALVKAATAKPAAKHFHALVRFVRGNAEVLVKLPRQSEFKPAVEGKFYPTGSTFRTADGAELEFGKDAETGQPIPGTIITREYPAAWEEGMEPYYPVNNERNDRIYREYKELAKSSPNVMFGGRLGLYQYFDMDKVIRAALDAARAELQ